MSRDGATPGDNRSHASLSLVRSRSRSWSARSSRRPRSTGIDSACPSRRASAVAPSEAPGLPEAAASWIRPSSLPCASRAATSASVVPLIPSASPLTARTSAPATGAGTACSDSREASTASGHWARCASRALPALRLGGVLAVVAGQVQVLDVGKWVPVQDLGLGFGVGGLLGGAEMTLVVPVGEALTRR